MALDVAERVQAGIVGGRRVQRENLHRTLAFLDEQPVEALQDLDAELQGLRAVPVRLQFAPLAMLGGHPPKALALDVVPHDTLTTLHNAVQGSIRRAGITLRRDRFRPHVTLTRFRRGDAASGVPEFAADDITHEAIQIGLFQSTLRPAGARYEALATYPLG